MPKKLMDMNSTEIKAEWTKRAKSVLLGRKITKVDYVEDEHTGRKGVAFELDSGIVCFVMSDDEGNDVGALHTTDRNNLVLPKL